jgi:chromosome segregation ATPase
MALTQKAARRDGWQNQADHLASTHTAYGMAALVLAEQTRRQSTLMRGPSQDEASEPRLPSLGSRQQSPTDVTRSTVSGNIIALERQATHKLLAPRLLNRQVQTLNDLTSAATQRITDLENELDLAREEIAYRDNENRSLQKSLELTNDENRRLSEHLVTSDATARHAFTQLKLMKAALLRLDAERRRTSAAADKANEARRSESESFATRLNVMASCAATADQLLAGMRRNLLEKFELLQGLLRIKECHVNELTRSRSKLIERTKALLKALTIRDMALLQKNHNIKLLVDQLAERGSELRNSQQAIQSSNLALTDANHIVKMLTEQVAKAEIALGIGKNTNKLLLSELQLERKQHAAAVAANVERPAGIATLQRELESYVKLNNKPKAIEPRLEIILGTLSPPTGTQPAAGSGSTDSEESTACSPEFSEASPSKTMLIGTVTF